MTASAHGFESHLGLMAKGKTPKHTACRKGTKVLIKLINGRTIIDTFLDRKGGKIFLEKEGKIFLEKEGKISKKEIRSFQVLK